MKARQVQRMRREVAAIGLAALLGMEGTTAVAQMSTTDSQRVVHPATTSPLLPDDHWVLDALRKAEALGLLIEHLPEARSIPQNEAGNALDQVLAKAVREDAVVAPLAREWQRRFRQEFPESSTETNPSETDGIRLLAASFSGGYEHWSGRVAPGVAQFPPDRTGPISLPEIDHPAGTLSLAGAAGRHVAVDLGAELRRGELEVVTADATVGWRRWMLSVGRRPVSYAIDGRESVLLSGGVPFDRIQIETRAPVRLGGPGAYLGAISFHTFLARLPDDRHPGQPFFGGARVAIKPHERLTVSLQRAAMFGGEEAAPITARRLLLVLLGSVEGVSFANQILSASFRYRLPTERVFPLTAYGEWGTEDGSGAPWDVPGIVVGIAAPVIPGIPEANLSLQYTRFGPSCCGNPPWYRHFAFPGNWSGPDAPFGHPIGGEGSEWRVRTQAYLARGRVRLDAGGFASKRSGDNLFVPGRAGASLGLTLESNFELTRSIDLGVSFSGEGGDDWEEQRLEVEGTLYLLGAR